MTRADRKLCIQIMVMIPGSVALMAILGMVMLWLVPPSDMERECVGKSLAELGQCLYDHRRR